MYVPKAPLRKARSKTPSLLLSLRRATASRCFQRNPPHSRQQPSWPCPCRPPSSSGPLAPCAAHPSSSSRWRSGPPPAHRTTHLSPIVGPDSAFTSCTSHNTSFTYCGAWLSLHLLHIAQHIFHLLWGLTQPSPPAHRTTHLSPIVGPDSAFTSCTSHNTSFTYCGAWLSLHLLHIAQHIFHLLWGLTQPSPPAHRTTHLSPIVGPDSAFTSCTSHNTSFTYCGAWLSLHLLHIAQHIFHLLWGLTQPSPPAHRTTHLSPIVGPDSAFTSCTSHNTSFTYCGAWLSLHLLHIAQHIFHLLWGLTQPSPPAHRTTHLSPIVGPDSAFTSSTSFTYCGAWLNLHLLHIAQHIFPLLRGLTQPSPAHRTSFPYCGAWLNLHLLHIASFPYWGAWLSLHLHIAQHIFPLLWGLTQPSPSAHRTTHLSPTVGPDSAFTCTSHNTSFPYCGAWLSLHLHITHLSPTEGPDTAFTCTSHNTSFTYWGAWFSLQVPHSAQHIFHLLLGVTQPSPAQHIFHLLWDLTQLSPTVGPNSAVTYCGTQLSRHLLRDLTQPSPTEGPNSAVTYCGT